MDLKSLLPDISLAVILPASMTIVSHYVRPPRLILIYIFRPLTTILILPAALVPGTLLTDPYARLIGLGLLFSLLGDIWLMLPKDRFLYDLVSFPLAHVCYSFAFLTSLPAHGFPWLVLSLSIIGTLVLAYPWPTLPARLKGAVSLYAAIIVTMATLSADQAAAHPSMGMFSVAIGALLFMASDVILAIDRFRQPFCLARGGPRDLLFRPVDDRPVHRTTCLRRPTHAANNE